MIQSMTKLRVTVALSILASACSGGATSNADSNAAGVAGIEPANTSAAAENAAAPATPAAAPAGALSAEFMVGKWSAINEDCSSTIDFRKDGTVGTPIGDAKWKVDGDKLSFDYGDGSKPTVSTVKPVSADRIEITHESGTKETEKRC